MPPVPTPAGREGNVQSEAIGQLLWGLGSSWSHIILEISSTQSVFKYPLKSPLEEKHVVLNFGRILVVANISQYAYFAADQYCCCWWNFLLVIFTVAGHPKAGGWGREGYKAAGVTVLKNTPGCLGAWTYCQFSSPLGTSIGWSSEISASFAKSSPSLRGKMDVWDLRRSHEMVGFPWQLNN